MSRSLYLKCFSSRFLFFFVVIFKTKLLLGTLDVTISVRDFHIKEIYLEFMVWFHFGSAVINSWSPDVRSDLRCHLVAGIWYTQLYFTRSSVLHPLLLVKENAFEMTCRGICFHFKHKILCTLLSVFLNMHVCFGLY